MIHIPKVNFRFPKITNFWKSTIWAGAIVVSEFMIDTWRDLWKRRNAPDPFQHF